MSFPQAPSRMDPDDSQFLIEWGDVDLDQCEHELERAGTLRNIVRHAEAWGPHLIAAMVESGDLQAGENPLEVLKRLIER